MIIKTDDQEQAGVRGGGGGREEGGVQLHLQTGGRHRHHRTFCHQPNHHHLHTGVDLHHHRSHCHFDTITIITKGSHTVAAVAVEMMLDLR